MIYIIGSIVWGVIWGYATQSVITNKGYNDNWFWWGFFFGFIALIVALTKPDNHYSTTNYSTPNFVKNNREYSETTTNMNEKWTCSKCGKTWASYVGSCSCGMTQKANAAKTTKESDYSKKLKEYKELLDAGILTQEEFDERKKSILSKM